MAAIKRMDAEAILNKGPQGEEHGDRIKSGRKGYIDQGPTMGGEWPQ